MEKRHKGCRDVEMGFLSPSHVHDCIMWRKEMYLSFLSFKKKKIFSLHLHIFDSIHKVILHWSIALRKKQIWLCKKGLYTILTTTLITNSHYTAPKIGFFHPVSAISLFCSLDGGGGVVFSMSHRES